jgi:hypothetical protein
MIMRRRPLLRAAALGGGAYLVGKHVSRQQTDQQYLDADQEARSRRWNSSRCRRRRPSSRLPPRPGREGRRWSSS